MCCESQILKEIKVVASLGDVIINNALTFENGVLQFRGSLVRDTDITGLHVLNLGIESDKISALNVNASNSINIKYNGGVINSSIELNSSGILVTDNTNNPKGLTGSADYSANYINNSYVQKVYVDTRIVSKQISAVLSNPTVTQNGYSITWDNTAGRFTLSQSGLVAGSNTQVIFNSTGTLTGDNNFTFNVDTLSIPNINLGNNTFVGNRTIQALSSSLDSNIFIYPKGAGNVTLGLDTGEVLIGKFSSPNSIQIIRANGNNSNVHISLEPKGTDGIVYIGNITEAGGFRYLQSRGNAADVGLKISSKGNGTLILETALNIPVYIGDITNANGYRILKAGSSLGTANFAIAGTGINSEILIGDKLENASNRVIRADSSVSDCNLLLYGKGTGTVFINGIAFKELNIGDWNMDSTASISIPHLLPDFTKIITVSGVIYNDAGDRSFVIGTDDVFFSPGYSTVPVSAGIDNTDISITRKTSGFYDSTDFDATGYNRGKIIIMYKI